MSIVKQTSGLIASDPLNNVDMTQQQLQSQNKYWTYNGSAWGEGAPFSFNENTSGHHAGFHIGVQALTNGRYAGFFAVTPMTSGQVFHAVITEPIRTTPPTLQVVFNSALYVQTGNGSINYVSCGATTTNGGTMWGIWEATGNTTVAKTLKNLWTDPSPNQPLTRSCTIVTNGSNSLTVYLDNVNVFSSTTLNLQMPSPFQAFIEVQTSYAGQMFTGTFTDFYASTTPSLTVTNLPSSASSVQLVDSLGNVMVASVSNGVAVFDLGGKTIPFSASIVVKDASGNTIVASDPSNPFRLVGGDTYAFVSN
jgi:hypothetical protein